MTISCIGHQTHPFFKVRMEHLHPLVLGEKKQKCSLGCVILDYLPKMDNFILRSKLPHLNSHSTSKGKMVPIIPQTTMLKGECQPLPPSLISFLGYFETCSALWWGPGCQSQPWWWVYPPYPGNKLCWMTVLLSDLANHKSVFLLKNWWFGRGYNSWYMVIGT
jgi:hypothetical protein